MDSKIAGLLIDIGVDSDDATKAAKSVDTALGKTAATAKKLGAVLKTLAKGFAVVGGAITAAAGAAFAFVDRLTQTGDEIGKTAAKLSTSTDELQRLRFAADRSGVSAETLTDAIKTQNIRLGQAAQGGAVEFQKSLAGLGLSIEEVQALSTEQRIEIFADRLSDISDESERTATAVGLFGEMGFKLAPLLNEGGKGIKALGDEAEAIGLVMREEAIRETEAFQDTITNAKGTLEGLARTIAVNLIPIVRNVVERVTEWIKANKDLIRSGIEEFFRRAVKALEGLAKAIGVVADNLDAFAALATGALVAKAFSMLSGGFGGLIGVAASAGFAIGKTIGDIIFGAEQAEKRLKALQAEAKAVDALRVKAEEATKARDETKAALDRRNLLNALEAQTEIQATRAGDEAAEAARKRGASEAEQIRAANAAFDAVAARTEKNLPRLLREGQAALDSGASVDEAQTLVGRAVIAQEDRARESAKAAAKAAKPKGGGGKRKAGGGASKPTSDFRLSDLGLAGLDLEAVAARTPEADAIEPTVALTINNYNVDFDLDQTINGATDPGGLASRVAEETRKQIDAAVRAAQRATATPVVG